VIAPSATMAMKGGRIRRNWNADRLELMVYAGGLEDDLLR
jgi:hypothetical protein